MATSWSRSRSGTTTWTRNSATARRKLVKDKDGKERLLLEDKILGSRAGIGGIGGVGARQGTVAAERWNTRRPQGRLRSARAHPRHGPRRHRRRLPLSEPRPVRRRGARSRHSPPRCAAPTTAGSPITASPIPIACSASRCCRCSRSSRRSRRCASPARSSASAAASCGPTRTTTASCTTRTTSRSGARPRSSTSRIGIHEGGNSGMPTVGIDRFEGRGAQHIISHTMEMMLACMSMIWGGVCERHPEAPRRLPGIGRRLDRAVARPHGPPFRRPGLQRFRPEDPAERPVPAQLLDLLRAGRGQPQARSPNISGRTRSCGRPTIRTATASSRARRR